MYSHVPGLHFQSQGPAAKCEALWDQRQIETGGGGTKFHIENSKTFAIPASDNACVLNHFSPVRLFVTPRTVAHRAPLSMGFSRQEYWSGLPCPPPGDLPHPGIKPTSLLSPALAGGLFTTRATGEAQLQIMLGHKLLKVLWFKQTVAVLRKAGNGPLQKKQNVLKSRNILDFFHWLKSTFPQESEIYISGSQLFF